MHILGNTYCRQFAKIDTELRKMLKRYFLKGDRSKNRVHLMRIWQFAEWFCEKYNAGSIHRAGSQHVIQYYIEMQHTQKKTYATLRNDFTSLKILWQAMGRINPPPAPKRIRKPV